MTVRTLLVGVVNKLSDFLCIIFKRTKISEVLYNSFVNLYTNFSYNVFKMNINRENMNHPNGMYYFIDQPVATAYWIAYKMKSCNR